MARIIQKSVEQKEAEAEVKDFEDDLGPFVVAAESTRMAMVFTDAKEPENPIIFANDSFLELTGYSRPEVLAQSFNFLRAHGADDQSVTVIEAQFAQGAKEGAEIRYRRKNGSQFWAAVFIHPVRDENGAIVQYFASFVDLTKHKDELAQSAKLIDELNHRVKNTLATVQSIVWQALRATTDPVAIREAIESRLFAMSRSHDLLTRQSWQSASMMDIAHDALAPFSLKDGDGDRIVIEIGEDVRLPPRIALALGIALNELATNAAKYGALSNATGHLLVQWTVADEPRGKRLVISWEESGGPSVAPPKRRGFGSQVLERGLALEIEAKVSLYYQASGLQCTIDIPLPGELPLTKLLAGRGVLVVEDEMLVFMMIEMMLGDLGCEAIVAASSVKTSLAAIDRGNYDIAMLDMNLGGDDSRLIADALDARCVPYLFCTGNTGGDRRQNVRERLILRKPFAI